MNSPYNPRAVLYNRMKLMFVGIQGIGKTSLLNELRKEGLPSASQNTVNTWPLESQNTVNIRPLNVGCWNQIPFVTWSDIASHCYDITISFLFVRMHYSTYIGWYEWVTVVCSNALSALDDVNGWPLIVLMDSQHWMMWMGHICLF